ncbi:MAG: nucleotidyltransferase family protein [Silicimonas sp.]|nr:nucleotidyltransferase family protein [Silicimonas sp.]
MIVIPAAGASSRMRGGDKLLETIDGTPLLRRQAKTALATGCPVLVCLPPDSPKRQRAVQDLPLSTLAVNDAAEGLGATLRSAAHHVLHQTPRHPMMVLLPDFPDVTDTDIKTVIARFIAEGGDKVVRATDSSGRPGTPILIPPRLLPRFLHLKGDDGGKSALDGELVVTVLLLGTRATHDLDTPEDWTSWRKARLKPR